MSVLGSIPLTSFRTLAVVAALALVSLLAGAFFLPRLTPARCPRRARRWLGRTAVILIPTLLVTAAGGLVFNRSLGIVKTSGDLGRLAAATLLGTKKAAGTETKPERQPLEESELDATFERGDDGMLTTTWTGPTSGITQPVYVIVPRDYAPGDGKTYGVIELLHGYPGAADGILQNLSIQEALDNAIDAGIIPPSIVVAPSLNVDENEHDCADFSGRPAVFTWTAHEVPAMIRHNFPGVSSDRNAWMIGGFSSGAYCAVWTALRTPETFGAAAMLSGYDTQIEGQMKTQGTQYLADNTLSTMLATRAPDGMRIYAMAAADDGAGGAPAALAMANAVKEPDSVTTDIPPTGGHAGPLWIEKVPTMLAWWGSSDVVSSAVGAPPTAQTARASSAFSSIVAATTVTHRSRPLAPNTFAALAVMCALALCFVILTWRVVGNWRLLGKNELADMALSRSRFCRPTVAAVLSALPRPIGAGAAYLARLCCLGLAVSTSSVLIGIASNIAGGFYTSWGSVALTLTRTLG